MNGKKNAQIRFVLALVLAGGLLAAEDVPVLSPELVERKAQLEFLRAEINGRIAELVEQAARAKVRDLKLRADEYDLDVARAVLVRRKQPEAKK